ncbi:MAG: type II toxin-antitoxin system RelE/ParE family toxin [Patescibacteria group bacterium]|jgi:mRNA interferase RelE/StbE
MEVIITKQAEREWKRLPKAIQARLKTKLLFFADQTNPLIFAKRLVNSEYGEYRFRIGDYRIIIDVKNDTMFVLKVGHRKEIYQ